MDYFVVGDGTIEISENRATFSSPHYFAASDGSTLGSTTVPSPPAVVARASLVSRANIPAAVLSKIESLASVGLAIYLLVVGILVFRGSPSGARRHAFYAWTKLALAMVATVASAWLWTSIATRGGTVALAVFGVLVGLSGALYPIGLLLALRSSDVREYYRSISAPVR